jgi:hypothetical protein
MTKKPQFVLHLEAQPRPGGDEDGMRRLRAILKVLLRSFGFKCTRIDYPNQTPDGLNTECEPHEQRAT